MTTFQDPEQLVTRLGIPFSAEQLEAITAPLEPAVIIAGAGTGKTTVMAARVVWLVGTGQVRPEQVLGLTFTRKAAGEMAARIRRDLQTAGFEPGDEAQESVLTYDSFAGRLVSERGLLLGLEPDSRLMDTPTRYRLAAKVVAQAPQLNALSDYTPATVVDRLLRLSAEATSHLVEADRLTEHAVEFERELAAAPANRRGAQLAAVRDARLVNARRLELVGLVRRYEQLKAELGFVEFADQMAAAARLASQVPEVGQAIRQQYQVVLLDEYQDTSSAQAQMLRGLFSGPDSASGLGHPVTAVGDPCQAIYGWRGAASRNILDFATSFPRLDRTPARGYALTINRRSGEHILTPANELARSARTDPGLDGDGLGTELVSPPGTPPGTVEVSAHATWPDELDALVGKLEALHRSQTVAGWGEIAVLARQNNQVADVYTELVGHGIPAEIVGLGGLLELAPIVETVAMLSALSDPSDNPATLRMLTSTRWAIGLPDLELLGRRAKELAQARQDSADPDPDRVANVVAEVGEDQQPSLVEAVENPGRLPFSASARQRFAELGAQLKALRPHLFDPLPELVQRVIDILGLRAEIAADPAWVGTLLEDFTNVVNAYVSLDAAASLTGFLAYLAAERENGIGFERTLVPETDSVKILTVHKAKGLEWPVVFLPGLTEGVFPNTGSVDNWLTNPAVLPHPLRGDSASLPELTGLTNPAFDAQVDGCRKTQLRSEDRLAYVALTRARQQLFASTHTWAAGRSNPRKPSPYLETLADHAQHTELDVEVPEQNPLADQEQTHSWPSVGGGEAHQLRLAAADRVRQARVRLADDQEPGEPALNLDEAELFAELRQRGQQLLQVAQVRPGGHPGGPEYLSVTGVGRLLSNPQEYALELQRPMPYLVTQSQRWGIAFHQWLESRFAEQAPLIEIPTDADLAGIEFQKLREGFNASPYASRQPVAVETPFTLVIGGRLIRGRIDAVFALDDGRMQVVDWKTGDATKSDPVQLACYRLAWAEMHSLALDRVDAVFYDLHRRRTVRPERLPDRKELTDWLAREAANL